MINVKLFVILILIAVSSNASEYCQICRNHTLCKYPTPGPSQFCAGYDATALLTRDNIVDIVSRINEKRNFIALGLSKNFPQAANMKKISWSEDLAWSAQRWVDQCDPNVRPDKEDQCRDLAFVPVGQNIATIIGSSPGLNTKSFVDMWYMQTMDYDGNVSLYNVSRDAKTNYLTQLIWAEVDIVGCGKARFYINLSTLVERLVCNFARRGNIHGKPVYAIGLPATQCPADFAPDGKYPALCTHQTQKEEQSHTPESFPATSVLRILNLTNTSKDIDPIDNNLNQSNLADDRHQKSRHVVNNSFDNEMPRFLPHPMQWHNHNHSAIFPINQHQHQASRAYHGYDHGQNHGQNFPQPYMGYNQRPNVAPFPVTAEQNFRRFDRFEMITQPATQTPAVPPNPDINTNFRKNFPVPIDVNAAVNYKINPCFHCTRGYPMPLLCNQPPSMPCGEACVPPSVGCGITPPHCAMSVIPPPHVIPHGCPCGPLPLPYSVPPVPPPPPLPLLPPNPGPCCELPPFPCSYRAPCAPVLPSPCCHRPDDQNQIPIKEETRRSGSDLHYYDLFPNVVMRSGDSSEQPQSKRTTGKKSWLSQTPAVKKNKQANLHQIQDLLKTFDHEKYGLEYTTYSEQERDYAYGLFDSRKRLKRQKETQWPIDDFSNPKTLRFTTLPQRRQKSRRTTVSRSAETETITIGQNSNAVSEQSVHRTEKYLSFNDLMHLRKNTAGDLSARRRGVLRADPTKKEAPTKETKATPKPTVKTITKSTTTTPPMNYTTSAPFVRKRYCTRKMTCTWTAVTNAAGEKIAVPGQINSGGSRTPPGYVEGCTRTSTCTRDYLNRNKISTLPVSKYPAEEGVVGEEEEDQDYCERRSLEIKKRNLNENQESDDVKESATTFFSTNIKQTSLELSNECDCAVERAKKKRDVNNYNTNPLQFNDNCNHRKESNYHNPLMSYGDLYYLVISKIMKSWEEKKSLHSKNCLCNTGSNMHKHNHIIFLFIVCYSVRYTFKF